MNQLIPTQPYKIEKVSVCTVLTLIGFLCAGCQPRLSFEKEYSLSAGELITLPIDAVGNEQTVHVSADSTDESEFTVHIYLAKHEEEAVQAVTMQTESDLILAKSDSGTTANVSARIPANESTIVQITAAAKPVTVNVRIHN